MKSDARPMVVLLGAALVTAGLAAIVPGLGLATAVAATAAADVTSKEPGASIDTAIRLTGVKDEMSGIHAEYVYIREHYPGWNANDQYVLDQDGRTYDRIDIVGPRGEKKAVYFDITDWFGK